MGRGHTGGGHAGGAGSARKLGGAGSAGRVVIGLLHPGEMGAAVGRELRAAGHEVLWASAGRSAATAGRAAAASLADCGSLAELVMRSDVIISVCPPHAAEQVAAEVGRAAASARQTAPGSGAGADPAGQTAPTARSGAGADPAAQTPPAATGSAAPAARPRAGAPQGIFVDANAISPASSRRIARLIADSGLAYVDGGIIGPPPAATGGIRLYLSGSHADAVQGLFAATAVQARVVRAARLTAGRVTAGGMSRDDTRPEPAGTGDGQADGRGDGAAGAASAVKMAYAAWTKGTAALLLAIRALARAEGVEDALLGEWAISEPALEGWSRGAARSALTKGWRWIGEMEEISASFAAASLPPGFHLAAAEVFRRSARSGAATEDEPAVERILAALLERT